MRLTTLFDSTICHCRFSIWRRLMITFIIKRPRRHSRLILLLFALMESMIQLLFSICVGFTSVLERRSELRAPSEWLIRNWLHIRGYNWSRKQHSPPENAILYYIVRNWWWFWICTFISGWDRAKAQERLQSIGIFNISELKFLLTNRSDVDWYWNQWL